MATGIWANWGASTGRGGCWTSTISGGATRRGTWPDRLGSGAAGLLSTDDWEGFLAAYRAAGGPGVPVTGDPWPALDLPARAAVVIAATRAVGAVGAVGARRSGADTHSDHTAEALLDACRKM
jgi:hypothetical protein